MQHSLTGPIHFKCVPQFVIYIVGKRRHLQIQSRKSKTDKTPSLAKKKKQQKNPTKHKKGIFRWKLFHWKGSCRERLHLFVFLVIVNL